MVIFDVKHTSFPWIRNILSLSAYPPLLQPTYLQIITLLQQSASQSTGVRVTGFISRDAKIKMSLFSFDVLFNDRKLPTLFSTCIVDFDGRNKTHKNVHQRHGTATKHKTTQKILHTNSLKGQCEMNSSLRRILAGNADHISSAFYSTTKMAANMKRNLSKFELVIFIRVPFI